MFKKAWITLIIICPLLFLFVGYPVTTKKSESNDRFQISSRCFEVGNMNQFIRCYKDHPRVSGLLFIQNMLSHLNDIQPTMGFVLLIFFVLQIICIPLFIVKDR